MHTNPQKNYDKESISLKKTIFLMERDKAEGKKIIMFHVCSAGQIQYLLPIYNELKRRNLHFSYYFASDYDIRYKLSKLNFPISNFITTDIAEKLELTDIFLEAEIYGKGPKHAKRVFVGHGQPNKFTYWPENLLKSFDYYFLNGELERSMFEVIKKGNPEAVKHITLINTGYPKLDDLINGAYNKLDVLNELGLNPNRPTVIYSPAWDPGGSLRTMGIQIVEQLLAINELNILVKLHPASIEPKHSPYYRQYTGGINWKKEFNKFANFQNFRYIEDDFINPYLVASDIMVNDFSGVALEFMLLDRPVIYIDCPIFYNKTLINWGNNPELAKKDDRFNAGRNAGTVINRPADLKPAVIDTIKNPNNLSLKRKALMSSFLYYPGKAAQVSADTIIRLLD